MPRFNRQLVFNFTTASAISTNRVDLSGGAFGTLLCPSAVNGRTVQFLAQVLPDSGTGEQSITAATAAALNDTALLSTAKTVATGANALTADEIRQLGAACLVEMQLSSAPASNCQVILLWKD